VNRECGLGGRTAWTIKAAGMYVVLHTAGKEVPYRSSLTDIEAKLDPRHFIRIHRSAIVNLAQAQIQKPYNIGTGDSDPFLWTAIVVP
jgi:two-component system LytT family response regulator